MNDTPVAIIKFNELGHDERGTTSNFALPRKQDDFIYMTRAAGSLSGNTYHQGKNDGTNPKMFILVNGELELNYRITSEKEAHQLIVQAPALIKVKPYVIHSIKALTNIIILECNSIKDIQDDRIKEQI